jgi:two-component system sensor histidine kinase YesM
MAERTGKGISLKHGLIALIGVCWVLPVLLILTLSGYFIRNNLQSRIDDTIETSVTNAMNMTKNSIDSALAASRAASYDNVIQRAWTQYLEDADGVALYGSVTEYLSQQYSYDENFRGVMLYFVKNPSTIYYASNRSNMGKTEPIRNYRAYAHEMAREIAQDASTRVRFFEANGVLYMLRNIVDSAFHPYAVIVMECDEEALFAPLDNIVWLTDASVDLNDIPRVIAGEGVAPESVAGKNAKTETLYPIERTLRTSDYTLSLYARSDGMQITSELPSSMRFLVLVMLLALPLLAFVIWAFYRYVTEPLARLIDAARHVKRGERGYEILPLPESREFRSLAEHFNSMSAELKTQFDQCYEEQLALQDARVKALQSQISPHFLNNTLEIINWEARMANNEKACRMIEALSTMLDAAMARGGSSVVTISEELRYVDAYLYILSERYGERLRVDKRIDESLLEQMVPRLILQPIVENAMEHGIEKRANGALTLRIYAKEHLYLEVENDGSMTQQDRENIARLLSWDGTSEEGENKLGRIGIRNVNRRLKILYGEAFGLSIAEIAPGCILARITLPLAKPRC